MLAHELNNHFMIFCEVVTSKNITHVHNVTRKYIIKNKTCTEFFVNSQEINESYKTFKSWTKC
jgi:hypothetical protein